MTMIEEGTSIDNVKCGFIVNDILSNKIDGASFDFAFDRGCFQAYLPGVV